VNDRVQEIWHHFPQHGHSILLRDNHFGVLEKMQKRKMVECYEEWMEMINKKFPVVEI
jgi:hypothetical protein